MTDLALIGEIGRRGVRLMLSDSTNAEEAGHTPSESTVGVVLRELFWEHSAQADHRRLLRLPHPPGAADRRGGPRVAAGRSPSSAGRCSRTSRLARSMGLLRVPRRPHRRHRGDRPLRAQPDLCDLHRLPGRAHERPGADGRPREPPGEAGRRRHGDHLRPPDPRQRGQRLPGDRRAPPGRRRRRAFRAGAPSTSRATPTRRSSSSSSTW